MNEKLTKKQQQQRINAKVEQAWEKAYNEFQDDCVYSNERLRYCSAWVIETGRYIFLQSYNTIVAFYDKQTDELYDILRLVYGFTSTSAQHIAKFRNDYCHTYDWFVWRNID